MYMLTKGNQGLPLIKLSEGYSLKAKKRYVTIVCGSNGEKLKPVKRWSPAFKFFEKEMLNAEFVSKTELIYIKAIQEADTKYTVGIYKYKLPDYLNAEVDYSAIRKTKPLVTELIKFNISGECMGRNIFDTFLEGQFTDAIISALDKLKNFGKDEIAYGVIK